MPEKYLGVEPEGYQFTHEAIDLNEGPVDISLFDHELRIVLTKRDLGEGTGDDCRIIDPEMYDSQQERGYKSLEDNEKVVLGRKSTYGAFEFSKDISSRHIRVSRIGSEVFIRDLDSKRGTYRLFHNEETGEKAVSYAESEKDAVKSAGLSIPAEWHQGRNEDAYFIDEENKALGVFDGVGGMAGSERASWLSAQTVQERLKDLSVTNAPREFGRLLIHEALSAGHAAILNGPDRNIATTATAAKVFENENGTPYVVVGSVGDSRAYLLRDEKLSQLTLDQAYRLPGTSDEDARQLQETLANVTNLSELSALNGDAGKTFRNRSMITGSLGGTGMSPPIRLSDFEIRRGDRLMVTSDGIHDNLADDEIESLANGEETAEATVNTLVCAALIRSRNLSHLRSKADDMTAVTLDL
jgi:protein phosphatase